MAKKLFKTAFILILSLSVLAACGSGGGNQSGDSGDSGTSGDSGSDSGKTYTVATDNSFVPFEFLNKKTGDIQGFDIDLIRAVAKEAGIKINIKPMKFTGVMAGLESGRYDIGIAGITITDKRDKVIDFSNPYYTAGIILAVQSDSKIKSVKELAGKTVGTRTGTTSHIYLKKNAPDAKVSTYPSIVQAYQDLGAGRLDAVLYDAPNVKYYIKTKAQGKIKTVGDVLTGEKYGIAFPQDSKLVDDVNKALKTIKENGTYDKLHKKWFGEPAE